MASKPHTDEVYTQKRVIKNPIKFQIQLNDFGNMELMIKKQDRKHIFNKDPQLMASCRQSSISWGFLLNKK